MSMSIASASVQRDLERAVAILKAGGCSAVFLFGSAARTTMHASSDLDLAVRGCPPHQYLPPAWPLDVRSRASGRSGRSRCAESVRRVLADRRRYGADWLMHWYIRSTSRLPNSTCSLRRMPSSWREHGNKRLMWSRSPPWQPCYIPSTTVPKEYFWQLRVSWIDTYRTNHVGTGCCWLRWHGLKGCARR